MRRIAIASLLFAFVAIYPLMWGALPVSRIAFGLPKRTIPDELQLQGAFVVFAQAVVGLVLGAFALVAPLFGRTRDGVAYAVTGVCLNLELLLFVFAQMSTRWRFS
jgi:hypothetical protein